MSYYKIWKQKITNADGNTVITAQSIIVASGGNNTVRQTVTVRTTSNSGSQSEDTDSF